MPSLLGALGICIGGCLAVIGLAVVARIVEDWLYWRKR
jgi:hypothetical protein